MMGNTFKKIKAHMEKFPEVYQTFGMTSPAWIFTSIHEALLQGKFEHLLEIDDDFQKEMAMLSFKRKHKSYEKDVSALKFEYLGRYIKKGLLR